MAEVKHKAEKRVRTLDNIVLDFEIAIDLFNDALMDSQKKIIDILKKDKNASISEELKKYVNYLMQLERLEERFAVKTKKHGKIKLPKFLDAQIELFTSLNFIWRLIKDRNKQDPDLSEIAKLLNQSKSVIERKLPNRLFSAAWSQKTVAKINAFEEVSTNIASVERNIAEYGSQLKLPKNARNIFKKLTTLHSLINKTVVDDNQEDWGKLISRVKGMKDLINMQLRHEEIIPQILHKPTQGQRFIGSHSIIFSSPAKAPSIKENILIGKINEICAEMNKKLSHPVGVLMSTH